MAKLKLTAKHIDAMQPARKGSSRTDYDTTVQGFAIRVTGTGYKSFLFCYGKDGKEYRMPLGPYVPGTGAVDRYRTQAETLRSQVKQGGNPVDEAAHKSIIEDAARRAEAEEIERNDAEAEAARLVEEQKLTFDQLADRYITEHASKNRSHKATARRIDRYLRPVWGSRKVETLGKADAKRILNPIRAAGKKAEQLHVRALISGIFTFAIAEDLYVGNNPCAQLKKHDSDALDARDRALQTPQELRALWALTDTTRRRARLSRDVAEGLRFVFLTGCRPGEAGGLRWSELDLDAAEWTKPRSEVGRSKTGRPDVIPLVPPLVAMLRARQGNDSPFVWPSGRSKRVANGGGPGALTPAMMAAGLRSVRPLLARMGVETFKPHDVRSTVATGLGRLQVAPHIIERILNHAKKGVTTKHYMFYEYLPEKRDALERWLAHLESVTSTSRDAARVIPLRAVG